VCYWYKDHKTGKREEEDTPALVFIGRMVQHIRPKGFHRTRYYGLHATCKAKKVRVILQHLLVALGRLIAGTYRIVTRKSYRERVWASTGRDPLRCRRCGRVMLLWQVWHPRYGVVYDELKGIKRGRYGSRGVLSEEQAWMGSGQSRWYSYCCRVRRYETQIEDIVVGSFAVIACPQCGGAMQEMDA
jgi:hypothetical protein